MQPSNIEKVEKALGEPVSIEFTEYERRLRNNLFFISVISIAMTLGGLQLDGNSSFLGLRFNGLTDSIITKGLFYINIYMLLHFFWCSIDVLQGWRIRLTGTKLAFITGAKFASEGADYPSDPRQSSLYNWWKDEAKKIGAFVGPLEEIERKLDEWEQTVKKELESKENPSIVNACQSIRHVSTDINKLKGAVEKSVKTIESSRIPASLKRFDAHFSLYLRSQNLRWLAIELLLPIAVGVYSICLLYQKLSI